MIKQLMCFHKRLFPLLFPAPLLSLDLGKANNNWFMDLSVLDKVLEFNFGQLWHK